MVETNAGTAPIAVSASAPCITLAAFQTTKTHPPAHTAKIARGRYDEQSR